MSERIVLVKGPNKSFTELGHLEAESGKLLSVRVADGSVTEVPRTGHVMVARGGINHILRVYPDQMVEVFEAHPTEVADQVLREAAEPQPSATIKKRLQALPVPLEAVDRVWNQIKSHLDRSSLVKVSAEKPKRYSWTGPERPEGLLPFVRRDDAEPAVGGGGTVKPLPSSAADPQEPTTEARDAPTTTNAPQASCEEAEPEPSEAVANPSPASEGTLVAKLRRLGGPNDIRTTRDVAQRLLECATLIENSPAEDLAALQTVDEEGRTTAYALLACLPKRHRLRDQVPPLGEQDTASFAQLVIGELTRVEDSERKVISPSAINFFDWLVRSPAGDTLPAALISRLIVVLTDQVHDAPPRLVDHTTRVLATALRTAPENQPLPPDESLVRLARPLRSLALEARGGRALFLATLYRVRPEIARREEWWRGFDFATLSAAATGPLSTTLNDEEVGWQYIRPVVLSFADGVATRRALSELTGAAPELLRHLPSTNYREAWRRVAGVDRTVAGWFEELTSARQLQAAREALDKAETELRLARSERRAAVERAHELDGQVQRATEQLTQMRQAAHANSDAHDRQVKLDVITALANLALTVMQSPAARSDQALMQTIDYMTGREGLEQLELWGAEVPYRPETHDSLGVAIEPGSPVLVLRPGYTYSVGGESVVLIKAHVGKK